MKKSFLKLIVCPVCRGGLTAESFGPAGGGDEIDEGVVACRGCEASYPVIGGVPRLLPPALRGMLWESHPSFFRRRAAQLPDALRRADAPGESAAADQSVDLQLKTAKSFGYEWQQFSEMLADYEQNARWYFERFGAGGLAGKLVLDAGCGTGRHTYYAAREAREIVAMDFSQAIEVAARNNREHPNAHFVQADIYHPPFRAETFDVVYSHGVLHHLPDPERGFRSLLPLVRAGGFVNVYLYWNLEGEPAYKRAMLRAVTAARRVTSRMPHPLLHRLSWLIAAGFHVAFVLPARALAGFGATSHLADRVPLGHYRKYSFRVLYTDQFDRFSAPIENRYGRADVAGWFERAGLEDVRILGGQGWRASGRRTAGGGRAEEGGGREAIPVGGGAR